MNLMKTLMLTAILLMLFSCSDVSDDPNRPREVKLQGLTMGTVAYSVKLIVKPQEDKEKGKAAFNRAEVHAEVEAVLKQLNQDMSNWIPDSELSRFNKSTSLEPMEISTGLSRVMAESIRLGKLSGGKLDVTVGPLVNLWGFGPEHRPMTVPTEEELANAKARTGLQHLSLSGNQLSKAIPNLYVDLSTIAKGYAVDLVAEAIERRGIDNYLVEIGGELRVKGFKHTGELWVAAIEKPITEKRMVHQYIVPKDNAVATSGSYRKYFEADGQRFSHIIDPDTGKPINHKIVSVTVIHPSSMTADGLSTSLMLMGEDKAFDFATKNDIAAYIISKTDNGFKNEITVKFMPYLK